MLSFVLKAFYRDFTFPEKGIVTKEPTFPPSDASSLPWTHPTLPSQYDNEEKIVIKFWHHWKGEEVSIYKDNDT